MLLRREKRVSKRKMPIIERICRAVDIPPEAISHTPHIEIHGRSMLKIDDGGKILLYSPDKIKVELPKGGGVITVFGEGLTCSFYNMGAVGIEGVISSVSLEDGERI
jgi:sporulation protein YqfC